MSRTYSQWVLYWVINPLRRETAGARQTKTKEHRMREVLPFFVIAEPLLSTEELGWTSTKLGNTPSIVNKLVEAETRPSGCGWLDFPGTELCWSRYATPTYCAFTPDEPCTCFEADWVLVGVALSVIFDEEVALTFVWTAELNFAVLLFEVIWTDCDRVGELAMIIVERSSFDLLDWSLQAGFSFPYPGHSHSLWVTSSIGLQFQPGAQELLQSDPAHALERSANGLEFSPGAVWVTCPMQPWNLCEWKSLQSKMALKVNKLNQTLVFCSTKWQLGLINHLVNY